MELEKTVTKSDSEFNVWGIHYQVCKSLLPVPARQLDEWMAHSQATQPNVFTLLP